MNGERNGRRRWNLHRNTQLLVWGINAPMRIALFHNAPSGGAKRAIYEWTRRLSAKHDIDVYTLSTADHDFCDIRPFVRGHHVFDFSPRRLFGSPFGRLNQLQRWRDLGELNRLAQRIARVIDGDRYQVVFAHTCRYTFVPAVLQFLGTPTLFYLHEPFGKTFVRQFRRPYMRDDSRRNTVDRYDPLIRLYRNRLEEIQLNSVGKTKQLLANSRFTQEQMRTAYGVEAPICHYGVNCSQFRRLSGVEREDFVLSVGELSPRKGFDFLVESLKHIPPGQRPELRLACNSVDPNERAYVERLAAEHGVDLKILINLDADDLAVQYNRARLCVYAPVAEPFGLVPLEAMSCGTAVVGVREGGVQESVIDGHTGLLTERDPLRFAAAIQRLLEDPAMAEAYGATGREAVLANWTWDTATSRLEEYLFTCAGHVESQ